MHESIVIRIVGDSGDGIQLLGEQLTLTAALSGRDVRTLPDFPAEIRAPSGTLAGVSGFQLAMSDQAIFTAGEQLDVLVVMNPAALQHSIEYLSFGGLLILNEDGFTAKDWEKAGLSEDFLLTRETHYQVIALPLIQQTLLAVESLNITHAQAKKAKNFYILGLVLWLFELPMEPCLNFIDKKFQAHLMNEVNKKTLLAGYNYGVTLELSRKEYALDKLERSPGHYRQVTGLEAVSFGLATLATKLKLPMLVAGYPITPASGILSACAKLSDFGLALFQAEDEIAAICACLGAAFGGNLAVTCTSGPGFDLKTEALGLAVVAELPLVVIDVQRAGASTGMPTKTGQADLNQAVYGRHDEAPLPVIAAKSPADCFQSIIEAFQIAVTYMTPVVLLMDAYLANAAEPWLIPDFEKIAFTLHQNISPLPYARNEQGSRSWNTPGTPGFIHQLGGLEKQGDLGKVSYDAENHQKMVDLRAKKIQKVSQSYPSIVIEGETTSSILVIAWGSTYGSLKTAIQMCADKGLPVAYIHLRHLYPLPQELAGHLKRYQLVLVAELNSGQLCQMLRADYLIDAKSISQSNGQPFSASYLTETILEEAKHVCL